MSLIVRSLRPYAHVNRPGLKSTLPVRVVGWYRVIHTLVKHNLHKICGSTNSSQEEQLNSRGRIIVCQGNDIIRLAWHLPLSNTVLLLHLASSYEGTSPHLLSWLHEHIIWKVLEAYVRPALLPNARLSSCVFIRFEQQHHKGKPACSLLTSFAIRLT